MAKYLSVKVLRISLGAFFIILGIIGVIPQLQESVFSLNDTHGLEIIFGIVEIICGLLLMAGLFTFLRKKAVSLAGLVTLGIWLLRILLTKFVWGLKLGNSGIMFIPQFSTWILVLSCELVIAASLYVLYRLYD